MNLRDLLDDHQHFHSDLQMDSFITVRAGGTVYGCYKQALRELDKRYRSLAEQYPARELLVVDIDELESLTSGSEFRKRRRAIRLQSKRLRVAEMDRTIADTEREFIRFYQQCASLKVVVGELTTERRAAFDSDMWAHHLKAQAAVDYMTGGRLGPNTVKLLQSLPPAMRQPLACEILLPECRQPLVDWFLSYSPALPDPQPLAIADVRRLVDGA